MRSYTIYLKIGYCKTQKEQLIAEEKIKKEFIQSVKSKEITILKEEISGPRIRVAMDEKKFYGQLYDFLRELEIVETIDADFEGAVKESAIVKEKAVDRFLK